MPQINEFSWFFLSLQIFMVFFLIICLFSVFNKISVKTVNNLKIFIFKTLV